MAAQGDILPKNTHRAQGLNLQTRKAHLNQTLPVHFWPPKMSSAQLRFKAHLGLQPLTTLEGFFLPQKEKIFLLYKASLLFIL